MFIFIFMNLILFNFDVIFFITASLRIALNIDNLVVYAAFRLMEAKF